MAHRQNVTSFEDSFAREYRELAATLPTKALMGKELSEEEHNAHLDEFYHYFDLCNEQEFLHQRGRISRNTWKFWHDGIASNLQRPAFRRAWNEICTQTKSDFSELRAIFPPDATSISADIAVKSTPLGEEQLVNDEPQFPVRTSRQQNTLSGTWRCASCAIQFGAPVWQCDSQAERPCGLAMGSKEQLVSICLLRKNLVRMV